MKCEKCGGEIEWGDRFCKSCGAPTHLPQFCPECGARVPDGRDVCPACGTRLEGAEPEEPTPAAGPSDEAAGNAPGAEPAGDAAGASADGAEPPAREGAPEPDGASPAEDAPADEPAAAQDEAAAQDGAGQPRDDAPLAEGDPTAGDEDILVEEIAEAEPAEVVEKGSHAFWDEPADDVLEADVADGAGDATQVLADAADADGASPAAGQDAGADGAGALSEEEDAEQLGGAATADADASAADTAERAEAPAADAAPVSSDADDTFAFDPLSEDSTRAYIDAILAQHEQEMTFSGAARQGSAAPSGPGVSGNGEAPFPSTGSAPVPASPAGSDDPTGVLADEDDGAAKTMELGVPGDDGPNRTMRLPLEGAARKRSPRVSLPEIDLPEIPKPALPQLSGLLDKIPQIPGAPRYAVPAALAAVLVVGVTAGAALSGGLGGLAQQGGTVAVAAGSAAAQGGDAQAAEPEVRDTVDDYSWDELAQISALIAQAPTDDEGIQIAARYHLCAADGTLNGTQVKRLTLSDGTETSVQVAGFRHDDRADGQGKAGITFLFTEAVATHVYNQDNTNAGGWDQSELRTWMNTSLLSQLPSDLQGALTAVSKATNNAGYAGDPTAVSTTTDSLWLPSLVELDGDQDPTGGSSAVVYNAEGSRYQLFSDADQAGGLDALLVRGQAGQDGALSWWMRSPYPDDDYCAMSVNDDGGLTYYRGTYRELGVVPGFCL